MAGDSLGEAGVAVLFGCQLKSLGRGLRIAEGWDGDRAALYENPEGRHALLWTSAWDSDSAAKCFASACAEERRANQGAQVTRESAQTRRFSTAAAESAIAGKSITAASAEAAGAAAVADAKPLSQNGYKVQLAKVAVKRALLAAGGVKG